MPCIHRSLLVAVLTSASLVGCAEQPPRSVHPAELVGQPFPRPVASLRTLDGPLAFGAHRFTLLRWWTDGCPHCRASLPALEALRRRVPGIRVVGVHHPKPQGAVADTFVREQAQAAGFAGSLAVDPEWAMLRRLRELGAPVAATSISVLVDRSGEIIWVHSGPRLHPSADGAHVQAAADFAALEVLVGGDDANK